MGNDLGDVASWRVTDEKPAGRETGGLCFLGLVAHDRKHWLDRYRPVRARSKRLKSNNSWSAGGICARHLRNPLVLLNALQPLGLILRPSAGFRESLVNNLQVHHTKRPCEAAAGPMKW